MTDTPDFPTPEPDPLTDLTPGQRLRHHQNDNWRAGNHPLSYALRSVIPLHIDANPNPTTATLTDRVRCGTCTHRVKIGNHSRDYPKCDTRQGQRITHGPGTDVLATWPGCTNWHPLEDNA